MSDDFDPFADDDLTEPVRPEDADRLLWRIRHLDAKLDDNRRVAAAQMAVIQRWEMRRAEVINAERDRLERLLEQWARANHRVDSRQTSWSLPHGVVRLAQPRYSTIVDDPDAAVKALQEMGADWLIKHTYAVRRDELLAVTVGAKGGLDSGVIPIDRPEDADDRQGWYQPVLEGEVIPGVRLVKPAERSFTQKPPPTTAIPDEP